MSLQTEKSPAPSVDGLSFDTTSSTMSPLRARKRAAKEKARQKEQAHEHLPRDFPSPWLSARPFSASRIIKHPQQSWHLARAMWADFQDRRIRDDYDNDVVSIGG